MLGLELGAALILAAWSFLLGRSLWDSHALKLELDRRSGHETVGDVRVRILRKGGAVAFVLGPLRPTIYLGDGLAHLLDDDELRAVVLHEDHHRRTRAPLRGAALDAWLRLAGRSRRVREVLHERLGELELQADDAAILRGATAEAIASALLKLRATESVSGAAFSNAAERRISALVLGTHGRRGREGHLAYEWLPLAVVALTGAACHLAELAPTLA